MDDFVGANITLTVLYVPYAMLLVFALHHARLRVKSQPSNIYSAHRRNVLGGATLSWSYIVLIGAVVLMFIFTTVAMFIRWSKQSDLVPPLMMGLNVLLADIILIWRCWIIYGRAVWVILFPSIIVAGDIVLLAISPIFPVGLTVLAAMPAISLLVTGYCTIVIAIRVVRLNRSQGGAFWATAPVLQIIVESAVLYSAALVVHIVLFSCGFGYEYSEVLVLVAAVSTM